MSEELIRDEGKIRRCPANIEKMGSWLSLREFHGYRDVLKKMPFYIVVQAAHDLVYFVSWALLFPVLPFLQCWASWQSAKKEVKNER